MTLNLLTAEDQKRIDALCDVFHKAAAGMDRTHVYTAMGRILADSEDSPERIRMTAMAIGDIGIVITGQKIVMDTIASLQASQSNPQ